MYKKGLKTIWGWDGFSLKGVRMKEKKTSCVCVRGTSGSPRRSGFLPHRAGRKSAREKGTLEDDFSLLRESTFTLDRVVHCERGFLSQ